MCATYPHVHGPVNPQDRSMPSKHIVCPHCHSINRLPEERFGDNPKCGACKAPLFDGRPVELGAAEFRTHLGRNDIPVVVDFWAPWCGPCRMMAPAYAQAAGELATRAQFVKVNTEVEPGLAAQYAIRSIPTLAVFRGGQELGRMSGALDARSLVDWVNRWL
jgi:thioredoxin 2